MWSGLPPSLPPPLRRGHGRRRHRRAGHGHDRRHRRCADHDDRRRTSATCATIAAFPLLARGTGVFQLLAGFLVNDAHRQANLAALVDLEHLDLDLLPFGHDVGRLLDPLVLHLGHVDETVLAAHEVHERTEVDDVDDLAVVDLADFGLFDDAFDPGLRAASIWSTSDELILITPSSSISTLAPVSATISRMTLPPVPITSRIFVLVDLHGLDTRSMLGHFAAGSAQRLGHFTQNVRAAFGSLRQRDLHDLLRDAGDLDVHLQAR